MKASADWSASESKMHGARFFGLSIRNL